MSHSAALAASRPAALALFREAMAALGPAEIPRGAGRITGAVRTPDGAPLAGVRIASESWGPPRLQVGQLHVRDDDPARMEALAHLSAHRVEAALRREAVTDAAGAFALEGLLPAEVRITPSAPGYTFADARLPPPEGHWDRALPRAEIEARTGDRIEIVARASGRLRVESRPFEDGPLWRTVSLKLRRLPPGLPPAEGRLDAPWSVEEPEVAVEAGAWEVCLEGWTAGNVDAESPVRFTNVPLRSATATVTVRPGATEVVRLDLEAAPSLRVRIVWPEGARRGDVEDLRILGLRVPPGWRPSAEEVLENTWGEFPREIGPGSWAVVAQRVSDRALGEIAVAEVRAGITVVDVRPPPPRESWVRLSVLTPDGTPDAEARVRGETLPREGDALLVPSASEERALVVESPRHGTMEVRLRPGPGEAVARFRAPASLVIEHEGPGRVLLFGPGGGEPRFLHEIPTGLRFEDLQPGTVRLALFADANGDDTGPYSLARLQVTVKPGENRIALPTPPLFTVSIVTGEAGRLRWVAEDDPSPFLERSRLADASGRMVLSGVGPGRYVATFYPFRATDLDPTPARRRVVRVPEEAEVRLDGE